jgi:fumarate reductase subunit D
MPTTLENNTSGRWWLDFVASMLLLASLFWIGWATAPGHMNADSLNMYTQAKTGFFHDWHSPLIAGLWHLLGAQPWVLVFTLFVTLTAFGFFCYRIYRAAGFGHVPSCLLTIATAYTPPVLANLDYHSKDTWVAVVFLAMVQLTISDQARPRFWILVTRNLAGVVGILVRPEFIFVVALFLSLEFLAVKKMAMELGPRFRSFLFSGLMVLAVYFALDATIRKLEHTARVYPDQYIYLSDLADLSVAQNKVFVPPAFLGGIDLETLKKHYRRSDMFSIFWEKPDDEMLQFSKQPADIANLKQAWRQGLCAYPGTYLKHRLIYFRQYLWEGAYFGEGIDPNPYGIALYHPSANASLMDYLRCFTHTFVQRHFLTFFGCPVVIALLLRRGPWTEARRILVIALLCAIFYQALFSVLGISPQHRFAYAGLVVFWIGVYIAIGDALRNFNRPPLDR